MQPYCTIRTELRLLMALMLVVTILSLVYLQTSEANLCDPSNEGTDYWHEVCMDEGPIDLDIRDAAGKLTGEIRI